MFLAQIFSDFLQDLEIRAKNISKNVKMSLGSLLRILTYFVKKKQALANVIIFYLSDKLGCLYIKM